MGRYTVTDPVGRGGMGTIYRAVDSDGRRVAIKRLHDEIASTPELATRFEREAAAQAMLDHPHIAALHAVGSTPEGEVFLVMELVEGPSLARRLESGPLPIGQALTLGGQVLRALHHAHQFGMVHRDLKPDNVLLATEGGQLSAKVIDFGLVKLLQNILGPEHCERLTQTGMVFGTPSYMPPEQILGQPVDARTDLYAMGIMLFEMLSGQLPYDSEEISELWNMHLRAPIPSLRARVPAVSEDVDAIVTTLLAKAPAERFDSALAVARALEGARH